MAHQLETHGAGAGPDIDGGRPIERPWHVDAGGIATVSALVDDAEPPNRDLVIGRRRRSRDVLCRDTQHGLANVVEIGRTRVGRRARCRRRLDREDVREQRTSKRSARGSAALSGQRVDDQKYGRLPLPDDVATRNAGGGERRRGNENFYVSHACNLSYALMILGVMKIRSSLLTSVTESRLNSQLINGI